MRNLRVHLLIPAFNEQDCLPLLLDGLNETLPLLTFGLFSLLIIDNACTDRTAREARSRGATVLFEPKRGYGSACLRALSFLSASLKPQDDIEDVVVFADADYCDFPDDIPQLLQPIANGEAELVLGIAKHSQHDETQSSLATVTQNIILSALRIRFNNAVTGTPRFRAITWKALKHIQLSDRSWGLPWEMQYKCLQSKIRCVEVAVRRRQRPKTRRGAEIGYRKEVYQSGAMLRTLLSQFLSPRKLLPFSNQETQKLSYTIPNK